MTVHDGIGVVEIKVRGSLPQLQGLPYGRHHIYQFQDMIIIELPERWEVDTGLYFMEESSTESWGNIKSQLINSVESVEIVEIKKKAKASIKVKGILAEAPTLAKLLELCKYCKVSICPPQVSVITSLCWTWEEGKWVIDIDDQTFLDSLSRLGSIEDIWVG